MGMSTGYRHPKVGPVGHTLNKFYVAQFTCVIALVQPALLLAPVLYFATTKIAAKRNQAVIDKQKQESNQRTPLHESGQNAPWHNERLNKYANKGRK